MERLVEKGIWKDWYIEDEGKCYRRVYGAIEIRVRMGFFEAHKNGEIRTCGTLREALDAFSRKRYKEA